jgi:hypothetical protein
MALLIGCLVALPALAAALRFLRTEGIARFISDFLRRRTP